MMRDDELLDVLAAALGPARPTQPSRAELARFHRAVRQRESRVAWWRLPRPLTAALAGFVVLGGASAAAASSGSVMPEPVRVAVRAVGLPVESPELADTRAAIARLRDALDARPRNLTVIRERAQELRDRLARLSADDRINVDAQANFLLVDADNAVAPPPPPAPLRPAAPPTTALPAPPVAGPDDHGSGDEHSAAPTVPGRTDGGGDTVTTVRTDTSGRDGGSSD
ncbi:MAG: hypothetical protein JO086_10855, partial [Acidimicrobiia bacterium]|nr:hypothetical protein [Acidimicrobiia bacterium]